MCLTGVKSFPASAVADLVVALNVTGRETGLSSNTAKKVAVLPSPAKTSEN